MGDEGGGVAGFAVASPGVHDFLPAQDGGDREAAAEGFAAADEIGFDAGFAAQEPGAAAAEAGEDLVDGQYDFAPAADFGQGRQPAGRRPAGRLAADDRFDQASADVRLPLEQLRDPFRGRAIRQTVHELFEWLSEGFAEGRPRGGRQRSEGGPVVCGVEREHPRAAAVQAARLQRDLHCVGARDGEVGSRLVHRRQLE